MRRERGFVVVRRRWMTLSSAYAAVVMVVMRGPIRRVRVGRVVTGGRGVRSSVTCVMPFRLVRVAVVAVTSVVVDVVSVTVVCCLTLV